VEPQKLKLHFAREKKRIMRLEDLVGAELSKCFQFTSLNAMQKHVLVPAFQTHENMVVASPTGS
jgi:hypothetical protein